MTEPSPEQQGGKLLEGRSLPVAASLRLYTSPWPGETTPQKPAILLIEAETSVRLPAASSYENLLSRRKTAAPGKWLPPLKGTPFLAWATAWPVAGDRGERD